MAKKRETLEFRYYDIPQGELLLALVGERWVRPYGYDQNDRPITVLHFHNLLEIGFCYEGRGEMVMEDRVYPYQAGTITVIPKNFPHATNGGGKESHRWEYLFLDVEKTLQILYPDGKRYAERFQECMSRHAFCVNEKEYPALAGLVKAILAEMTNRRELHEESVRGLLRALFVEFARCDKQHETARKKKEVRQPQTAAPKTAEQAQLSRALEYVAHHYEQPVKISELAELCHISEPHFRRLFVQQVGIGPADYVNQVRVRMVCDRLKKTNEPIAHVAVKCGFSSLATFNRNFRKFTGITPQEWRKQPEAYERRLRQKMIAVYDGW